MSRLSLRAVGLAALIAAALPSPAAACRFNAPIPDRIANSGAEGRERLAFGAAGIDYPLAVALEADPGLSELLTAAHLK